MRIKNIVTGVIIKILKEMAYLMKDVAITLQCAGTAPTLSALTSNARIVLIVRQEILKPVKVNQDNAIVVVLAALGETNESYSDNNS